MAIEYLSERDGEKMREAIKALEQESKTGHWREDETNIYTCSNCSHCFSIVPEDNSIKQYKYCPNCRAKMYEPQESEE